jgi:hypothetical protein
VKTDNRRNDPKRERAMMTTYSEWAANQKAQGAQDAVPKSPNGTCPFGWTSSGLILLAQRKHERCPAVNKSQRVVSPVSYMRARRRGALS